MSIVRVQLDMDTLALLDRTGKKRGIFTFNTKEMIRALCTKSLDMILDFNKFTDSILTFLAISRI